ncbi:hypothetical protein ABT093_09910 [Kitasatospora sp. NPDC002551]|uniref:hypothetical protein n=1 Tax=Kitasatospora sp. NPDC002551 TaxID=3154539 RepID=UPI003323ECF7
MTQPADRITLEVSRDGWTNKLQLSINHLNAAGRGLGYRLAGPKFNGSSTSLLKTTLDERDATEIRGYLDAVFPLTEDKTRRAAFQEGISGIVRLMSGQPKDSPELAGLQAALVHLHALREGTQPAAPSA